MIAKTPKPPYYAVIFVSKRTEVDKGYGRMADHMVELAEQQAGYLGIESFRNADGYGVTISYWDSLEAIKTWKANLEHQQAQKYGKAWWYSEYQLRVAKVEYDYGFDLNGQEG